MSHDTHVVDGINKDAFYLDDEKTLVKAQETIDYYKELAKGWKTYLPDPVVMTHDNVRVVRDDFIIGTKARAADLVLSRIQEEEVVYCQPRVGLAGVSVIEASKIHGKRVTLFMPSSKKISYHQACTIERGANPIFKRIAAMPNLNREADIYAKENGAYFIPLGLKHPLATAAIMLTALQIPEPEEVYVATSTGVLTRALQIAWPNAKFISVAVARNMKAGELGRAQVISEALDFQTPEKKENLPPFPSVSTYDAKVWKYIPKDGKVDRLFWNVGQEPILFDQTIIDRTLSYRDWK